MFKLEQHPLGFVYIVCFAGCGLAWILAALAPVAWLSVLFLGVAAVFAGMTNVVIFAFLQALVPARMLGRVMAFVMSASELASRLER